LLLVGDMPPIAPDTLLRQHVQAAGYEVEVLPVRNVMEANTAAAAAVGQRLILLSTSMPQGPGLPRAVRDLAVGIICLKPVFLDNLAMGNSPFGESMESMIKIVTPAHPLAAGRTGLVPVSEMRTPMTFGEPGPGATIIATAIDDPVLVTIFAFDKGAMTPAGPTAARRVAWIAQGPTIMALNANGWALFEAAVRWTAAQP
jgi:hypothetical protein